MNNSNVSFSHNDTGSTSCGYQENEIGRVAQRTAFVLVCAVGITANICVIVLAVKFTVRKNLHHLIINMAVADALYLLTCLLLKIPWLSQDTWTIIPSGVVGVILCKGFNFFNYVSYKVSALSLLVISIERFRATRRTLQRSRPYTMTQRVAVLGVCWFPLPMIDASYFAYLFDVVQTHYGPVCTVQYTKVSYYVLSTIIEIQNSLLLIICVTIKILSSLTIRRLSRHQAIHAHINQEQRQIRRRRTRSAVRMVLASAIMYMCCWLPCIIVLSLVHVPVAFHFKLDIIDRCIYQYFDFIVQVFLPIINSCFSPFLYMIFLSDFREAARKVLCRRVAVNPPPDRPIQLQQIQQPNNPQ